MKELAEGEQDLQFGKFLNSANSDSIVFAEVNVGIRIYKMKELAEGEQNLQFGKLLNSANSDSIVLEEEKVGINNQAR